MSPSDEPPGGPPPRSTRSTRGCSRRAGSGRWPASPTNGWTTSSTPRGERAGALFNTLPSDDPDRVTGADLLAVSTLGPALPVPVVRQVLADAAKAERIRDGAAPDLPPPPPRSPG